MSRLWSGPARVVTRRPIAAVAALFVVAGSLGVASVLLADQAGNEFFLPDDSDVADALATLSTSFPDSAGSALTTALGFGVLLFSPLIPFQQFGLVTGITILYSLIAALVVVPPLLVVWAAYDQWHRWHILDGHEWTAAPSRAMRRPTHRHATRRGRSVGRRESRPCDDGRACVSPNAQLVLDRLLRATCSLTRVIDAAQRNPSVDRPTRHP